MKRRVFTRLVILGLSFTSCQEVITCPRYHTNLPDLYRRRYKTKPSTMSQQLQHSPNGVAPVESRVGFAAPVGVSVRPPVVQQQQPVTAPPPAPQAQDATADDGPADGTCSRGAVLQACSVAVCVTCASG